MTDAGSTDQTLGVLRDYPHLQWTSEPDRGMSDGINKGFLRATGDWVMWLNTDDYLLPGALFAVARACRDWPDAVGWVGACQRVLPGGELIDFRRLRPQSTHQAYKYYVKGKMPAGWCGLTFPSSNFSLRMSFPVEQVPYLGILPNEGGWQDFYNIFLEPCTATFDRPDTARYRKENSIIQARSVMEWHLHITLAEGIQFKRILENGELGTV